MPHRTTALATIGLLIGTGLTAPATAYQTRPNPPTTRPMPPGSGPQVMPVRPGPQRGFAGRIRCESQNNNRRRCNARTQNRVVLIREFRGTTCREGRNWFFDNRSITVTNNCRAEFAFGFGNFSGYPYERDNRGPNVGAVIAGVAVAGGLLALLSSNNNRSSGSAPSAPSAPPPPPAPDAPPPFQPGPPAGIVADFSALPAAARPVAQTCMFEAARQVGVTGGTQIRHDSLVSLEPGNGGWRIRSNLIATYPDGDRTIPMFCRATPTNVIELTFG